VIQLQRLLEEGERLDVARLEAVSIPMLYAFHASSERVVALGAGT